MDSILQPHNQRRRTALGNLIGIKQNPRRNPRRNDNAFAVRAGILLELDFDPADGFAIAIRSLAWIAELRQPLDDGLVAFQIESIDGNLQTGSAIVSAGPCDVAPPLGQANAHGMRPVTKT
jgi:hypothetical protein